MIARSIKAIFIVVATSVCLSAQEVSWSDLKWRADSLWVAGHFDSSITIARQVLSAAEAQRGPSDTAAARALNILGDYCRRAGRYKEARKALERALAIRVSVLGEGHLDVAETCDRFGILRAMEGSAHESEEYHQRALGIRERVYGGAHRDFATKYYYLGKSYNFLGHLASAELFLRHSISIWEELGIDDEADAALPLTILGQVCTEQGRYDEAKSFFLRSLTILEAAGHGKRPHTARALSSLANLYSKTDNFEAAIEAYKRSIAILETAHGLDYWHINPSAVNLAHLYRNLGEYQRAEDLYRRAIRISEKSRGTESPHVSYGLIGLAQLFDLQSRYDEAEPLYRRALTIDRQYYGDIHQNVSRDLENYGVHYLQCGKLQRAMEMTHQAFESRKEVFLQNVRVLSERDALAYSQAMRRTAHQFLQTYLKGARSAPAVTRNVAEVIFEAKGEVSDGIFARRKSLVAERDSAIVGLAQDYCLAKRALAVAYVKGKGDQDFRHYQNRLDSLGQLVNDAEAELVRRSASFRRRQWYRDVSLDRIAAALPTNSVLLEYIRFKWQAASPDSATHKYLVLALTHEGKVNVIDLGDALVIDSLADCCRRHMISLSRSGSMPSSIDQERYDAINAALYEKIIESVEPFLSGANMLFVAPDAALNLVSFAGLKDKTGRHLIERYPLQYLSSGRDLIRLLEPGGLSEGLLAIGDPDYDAGAAERLGGVYKPSSEASDLSGLMVPVQRGQLPGCEELTKRQTLRLPGSRREVERIAEIWRQASHETVVMLLGKDASEDRFKSEAPGKRVLHLATHGYFLGGVCLSDGQVSDSRTSGLVRNNPLLYSGLFFAGCNRNRDRSDSRGLEDGILTAEEVAGLALYGTELVVLSACESGLGEIQEGEGVYGLRRAFQMAGARTVVSSLWAVSDIETAAMMSKLYERVDEPIPIRIQKLQLEHIARLREQGKPDHPVSWAAFIAQGGWQ